MNVLKRIFLSDNNSTGSMLIELLLSVALAAIIVPFVFKYQHNTVLRAQNIAIANQMSEIQVAMERYIVENRTDLLKTVGRNIIRISLSDLVPYGVPDYVFDTAENKYQLRILKSADSTGNATLQGVIVRESSDITPLRTREIVNLSGGSMGFVDGTRAHGTFGVWHEDAVDLGIDVDQGIIETTSVNRDAALYLWRVPSVNSEDATMMSALNLGGHDIIETKFLNSNFAEFNEDLKTLKLVAGKLIFQNRTTINQEFKTVNATVSGTMSADGKNMEIAKGFTVSDIAKLSSLNAENLWVSNLTLPDISLETEDGFAMLKINQALDMMSGRIEAMFVTVGFAGSMTPRLVVYERLEDSVDSAYYWDAAVGEANFFDASFVELNRMAALALGRYGDKTTDSYRLFSAVSANKNATVADFMNAISEIQTLVRQKYRQLNLE